MLNVLDFNRNFDRQRDFVAFVLAVISSAAVSATIGVASLYLGGVHTPEGIIPTLQAWWVGDVLGGLILGTLILVWATGVRTNFKGRRCLEGTILLGSIAVLSVLMFGGSEYFNLHPFLIPYLVIPFVIWSAIRFRQIGSVTTVFIISLIAVCGIMSGFGP